MKRFACALLCLLAWPVLAQNAVGSLPPAQLSAAEESEVDAMVLPVPGAWIGDLDGMRASRTVRILVPFSKTFYQVDRGRQAMDDLALQALKNERVALKDQIAERLRKAGG